MARRKTTIPKTLPLRSSGWTRFRWLASGGGFKSSAWVLVIALITGVVWSQWGVIQPAAASGLRSIAVAILGEDVVGAPQNGPTADPQDSILEPASAKQRQALTEAIESAAEQVTATGTTLPATSYSTLNAVVADCEGLILDPSIQSVSVAFCTQQIETETAALKKATADEVKRVADEAAAAEAARLEAERLAAEEAARQAEQQRQQQQQNNNNDGGDNGGTNPGGGGGNPTVTWTLTCGGVVKQTVQAPLNATFSSSGNCSWSHN